MQSYRLVSTVDHLVEHPDVWTQRLSHSKWGDRIPHIDHEPNGSDCWRIDGRRFPLSETAQIGALMTERNDSPKTWDEVPPSAYVPTERLRAMDRDHVEYSVLYPMFAGFAGENLAAINDPELELACVQAYNDWVIDEWTGFSNRFLPQCLLPLFPSAAATELKRSVKKGHKGAVFLAAPMHIRSVPHINSSEYDLLWSTCQELNVPLCFHAGSSRQLQYPMAPNWAAELGAAMRAVTRPASAVFDFVNFLFSRILLRFPNLKVVFAESTIGWGTFILEYADHQYEQDHCDYELKPSEMFKRQCYLTAWYDRVPLNGRYIGSSNIMWATNFPSANSTWPETSAFVNQCFLGVPDSERNKVLWENAASLYGI